MMMMIMDIISELPILPSLVTFLLFFLLIFIFIRTMKKPASSPPQKFPPGPPKLPVIGSIHHMLGPLPYVTMANLANKYGPFMHLQLGELSLYVVSSAEVAKQVLKTHDMIFSSRPYIPSQGILTFNNRDIASAPYGEYWRQMRKIIVVELLSTKRVQSYGPIREKVLPEMVRTISSQAGSPVNVTNLIYTTTFGILLRAAFGESCKFNEEFIRVVRRTIELAGGFSIADLYPSWKSLFVLTGRQYKCKKIVKETNKILTGIIEERRARMKEEKWNSGDHEEDILQVLLDIQDRNDPQFSLTTTDVKGVIADVFGAGSDTSSSTVEWAMSEMAKNPTILEKAQAEVRAVFGTKGKVDEEGLQDLKYLKAVIKETLRAHPPAPLFPRVSVDECEFNGFKLPSNTEVMVNIWAIGRDPNHWTEPDKFVPERFLESSVDFRGNHFEFLPFGAGRRICPGIGFGLANAERLLAEFLYNFDWKLPHGQEPQQLDMTELFGSVVGRKNNLFLIPIPYVK